MQRLLKMIATLLRILPSMLPTVLIASGEHYVAVLNLDFDYVKYLATLATDGLNFTRTFSGAYIEPQDAFNIAENTLSPKAGRFISSSRGIKAG